MKPFIKIVICTLVAFSNHYAFAQVDCSSTTTSCWDPCTGSFVTVYGAVCTTTRNTSKGCWQAVGKGCDEDGKSACENESVTCYDPCSSDMVRINNANTCSLTYSAANSCMTAVGSCE